MSHHIASISLLVAGDRSCVVYLFDPDYYYNGEPHEIATVRCSICGYSFCRRCVLSLYGGGWICEVCLEDLAEHNH